MHVSWQGRQSDCYARLIYMEIADKGLCNVFTASVIPILENLIPLIPGTVCAYAFQATQAHTCQRATDLRVFTSEA